MFIVYAYMPAFCRIAILLVFLASFIGKVRHIAAFQETITSFALVSRSLSRLFAPVIVFTEAIIVICMLVGGGLLFPGFLLAGALLLLFCLAMLSVLARKIATTCSCFGPTAKPVSPADIVRNVGFVMCALGGCWPFVSPGQHQEHLNIVEWAMIGLGALVFTLFWTQLSEIIQLFRRAEA